MPVTQQPKFNSNQAIPILFLGDGADSHTGLGRIGHDLAWLASSMPEFKVGYLGRQAFGRAKFPWVQYSFSVAEQWGEERLEEAWQDLSQGQRGIIFTLWDASRLLWFVSGQGTHLEPFLKSFSFERWGYFMADAAGVRINALPMEQAHVVSHYDRVAFASRFGTSLAGGIEGPEVDWLPHPINRDIYQPMDRTYGRSAFGVGSNETLIGCVMTNQARKHWPTVLEAVSLLPGKPRLWIHTDLLYHYWDIRALAIEYGIESQIVYEGRALSDKELAMRYAACDVTLVISGGEGFCYPVAESLSCGVPVLTGSYGAQAELAPWHVDPVTSIIDTNHNVRRAIYEAQDVASELGGLLMNRPSPEECVRLVTHLNMRELGLVWKKWFHKGLK
jgi:glycosyltransferase involved in cell wall biosynthesis